MSLTSPVAMQPPSATYGVPQTAPGLLAWIDSACEWELNRRRDFDYPLLPPEAAIDPPEDEVSINAVTLRRYRPYGVSRKRL